MRTPAVLTIALALVATLTSCASGDGDEGRAEFAAMLRVEEVPGVIVASYANWVQIDPAAPEDEIVETLVAVREILAELDPAGDATFVAVYPGDPFVNTEFTTRVLDDAEKFERDARTWASLLDEGFTEVRYNVHDENGDGVLNVHYDAPDDLGPSMSEAFEAMVGALSEPRTSYAGLQTEAVIGDMLATNRTGSLDLPPGWPAVLDAVAEMDFVTTSNAQFTTEGTSLQLRGLADLSAEQLAQLATLLDDNGVVQQGVTVTYTPVGSDASVLIAGVQQ